MNNKSLTLQLDSSTSTTGNAEQVAQLIGAAAWHISGDSLVVENCALSYRVTDNETYARVEWEKIPNGATVELLEGEQRFSYDLGKEEQRIEQDIQDKGLTAPRLTPEDIDSKIKAVEYILPRDVCKRDNGVEIFDAPLPLRTLTFCMLTLENGYTVTGESACVSPEKFDAEIGKEIAYKNAREKIWQLEGYLLKEKLSKQNSESQIQSIEDNSPRPACHKPWMDVPTNKIIGFIGSTQFKHMPVTETTLEHWKCILDLTDGATIEIGGVDVYQSHASAILAVKEIAFKNGWLK